ncbi:MAG: hypothetical protein KBD31_05360, partial [Proteobacteria bacterium]|nr:hypothetical protein [Pseudomonadota bacterium]
IIDALKCDITPLKVILLNENVVKIFHAARQDLEIFFDYFKSVPLPFFDLQIAAGFLNFGSQSSLEFLSENFLNVKMDKKIKFSEWDKRPLTEDMIVYAYYDARMIFDLYPILLNELKKKERLDWIESEHDYLNGLITNPIDLGRVFFKMKHSLKSKRAILQLFELSLWREEKTRTYNKPKERFLSSKSMDSLIKNLPLSKEKYKSILFKEKPYDIVAIKKECRDQLFDFLNALSVKKDFLLEDLPVKIINDDDLRAEVLNIAHTLGIDASYLLKKEDIKKILMDQNFIESLPTWKRDVLKNMLDDKYYQKNV